MTAHTTMCAVDQRLEALNLAIGQVLLIDLQDGVYTGVVHNLHADRGIISLVNVRDVFGQQQYVSEQTYIKDEIQAIRVFLSSVINDTVKTAPAHLFTNDIAFTKVNLHELHLALAKVSTHQFFNQTEMRFHEAMNHLEQQTHLALAMEECQFGRISQNPSLLTIGSKTKIFVFDIKWMGCPGRLSALLSKTNVKWVAHNTRPIRDVLKHRFNVTLGDCFDTMVAHLASTDRLARSHNDMSLQSCIASVLYLPKSMIDEEVSFSARPINFERTMAAAKNVSFLFILQQHLIHEKMLNSLYDQMRRARIN